ncbi:MAG TPA: IS3 family transposase [Bacillota bacterium]|nr:IS3 family transposase [Bacillota bacterium]HPZ54032.1 IS3 family transposase [Bacillota bacterium]HQD17503.1 IS3 family transposase [Bacillota bacterium]
MTRTDRRALVDWDRPIISIKVQAKLLSLNRSGLYYSPVGPSDEEVNIKRAIDRLHYDHPSWGSRKIAAMLKSQGYRANRKRVQHYMREMAITVVYPGPNLSKRNQQHHVYPYLLRDLSTDHVGQVYATDITYIPLKRGWMYLTAVIDWYSRYIVSWELSDSLHTDFVIQAANRAFAVRMPEIMNSDQGCQQYTCQSYIDMMKDRGVRISMDGRGRALDNVVIERFWRTLKRDEVYLNEYATPREAREAIARYIKVYNSVRPHQSLGNRTPAEVFYGSAEMLCA